MNYGWIRQLARDTVNAPDLATVMEEAQQASESESLLDRIVNGVKRVLPGAVSAAKGALAQLSYSGNTGNFASAIENITLTAKFQSIVDQAPSRIGSPLYKSVYINTLSGFVLCERPVFHSTTATTEEESAVEEFMSRGFFYE